MAVSEAVIGLGGALIGGGAAVSGSWLQARAAERGESRRYQHEQDRRRDELIAAAEETRRRLTRRYLLSLQESVESLRRRLDNWVNRGGELVAQSDPGYWEDSTLYAFGRALASGRRLVLEGVYADLSDDFARFLTTHNVNAIIADVLGERFFYYHRLTLAEAMLEHEQDGYRLLTFSEFRRRCDDSAWALRTELQPASHTLRTLADPDKRT